MKLRACVCVKSWTEKLSRNDHRIPRIVLQNCVDVSKAGEKGLDGLARNSIKDDDGCDDRP